MPLPPACAAGAPADVCAPTSFSADASGKVSGFCSGTAFSGGPSSGGAGTAGEGTLGSTCQTASCTELANAYKTAGQWVTSGYKPGDVVMFDFSGRRSKTEHVGIVEKVGGDTLTTIEGNTGAGNDANGGAVMRRTRKLSLVTGACRPNYNL